MRGALIGCGFFAQNHLNAWRDMRAEGIELVAVCDVDPDRARTAAEAFGVPRFYSEASRLFAEEKLDFVDIATRFDTHRDLAEKAFAHGVPAIVQKPLARDLAECRAIVAAAARAGVEMAVHENFRFQTPMTAVKAELDSGAIGAVTWARIAFRTGYDVYRTQPYFHQEKRFAILDVGIHVLDLARFFLGEVEHISCEIQRRNAKNLGEDTATMLLRHKSGAISLVECTYENREMPDPFPETLLVLEGERGAIRLDRDCRMTVTSDGASVERDVGAPLLPWTTRPWHVAQESVLRTQQAIINAWRQGKSAATSGADNLRTFALVEAAYRAAETARATRPEE